MFLLLMFKKNVFSYSKIKVPLILKYKYECLCVEPQQDPIGSESVTLAVSEELDAVKIAGNILGIVIEFEGLASVL